MKNKDTIDDFEDIHKFFNKYFYPWVITLFVLHSSFIAIGCS